MISIERPKIAFSDFNEEENYLELTLEPLERGFGNTLGNSLRRIMLSSLPGCAVKWIKCNDLLHEISSVDGVKEDLVEIILNIKGLVARINSDDEEKIIRIEKNKAGEITAADIIADSDVEIFNPDMHIATLSENKPFYLEMGLVKGRGYVSSDENKKTLDEVLGVIAIDSIFTPIVKTNYFVEPTRVGNSSNYDKLVQRIWTNGSITPEKAVSIAAKVLNDLLGLYIDLTEGLNKIDVLVETSEEKDTKKLELTIEELELGQRNRHCLKRENIFTVQQLIQLTEEELLKMKNLGKKSVSEIKEKLAVYELELKVK